MQSKGNPQSFQQCYDVRPVVAPMAKRESQPAWGELRSCRLTLLNSHVDHASNVSEPEIHVTHSQNRRKRIKLP
jgi:hypothetical protein